MTANEQQSSEKNGHEPSMFLQRPSSGRCQDISHVLTRIFRDVYANDSVDQVTVKNLTTSKSGKSGYHDKYVENLQKIQQEWEKKMEIAKSIEQHITEAHVKARQKETLEEETSSEKISNYNELGLPSVESHLSIYLDADTLRNNNLIVPQDFITVEKQVSQEGERESTPQYARPTTSSIQRYRKSSVEDNYFPESPTKEITDICEEHNGSDVDILKVVHSDKEATILLEDDPKSQRKKEKPKQLNGKHVWRDGMKPAQRMVERKDLEKLQKKSDFLKNPRFVPLKSATDAKKDTKADIDKEAQRSDPRKIFQPSPDPVVFTDYKPGEVYEIVFSLKNLTSSSRQVRVLPPASSYFSVGLGKFPTSDGLVAPGMDCQYSIRFAPDSLADYDDVLKVETTFADPLFISLKARRPPPNLSLSSSFDCGHCLVNGRKTVTFNCVNSGGEGRFCVLPRSKWPAKSWQFTNDNPGTISLGPFSFKPAMFHLKNDEFVNIQITFSPDSVKKYKEEIVLACDNCNTKEFVIEGFGETAGVELISVEEGLSEYELGEMKDTAAQYLVRFENQYPNTMKTKKLVIKNTTAVDLHYKWVMDRPVFSNNNKPSDDVSAYNKATFEITPAAGKLIPLDVSCFNITFKPTEVSNYHNVARLVLQDVPSFTNDEDDVSDLTATQIELKGYTQLFDVDINPRAFICHEEFLVNQLYEYEFTLENRSTESITFCWPEFNDEVCSIDIHPKAAVISPGETCKCNHTVVCKRPGLIKRTCVCDIAHVSSPVFFQFEAIFCGPSVSFSETVLNFGLVRHLKNQVREIELENHSTIPARWNYKEDLTNYHKAIALSPTNGEIPALSSQTITVNLNADTPCMLQKILEFEVEHADSCFLETRAVIQRPKVCLLTSHVTIEECYVNVPASKTVCLQNLTLFSVEFCWSKMIGKDGEHTSVSFQPESGSLKPREKLEFEMTLNFRKQAKVDDLFAVCEVEGMKDPIFLSIKADVNGLEVEYSTPNVIGDEISLDPKGDLKLEFGYDASIDSNPRAALLIKNKSGIIAPYSLYVEHFHSARIPTPPGKSKSNSRAETKSRGRALLGKTPNIADPFSKTPETAFRDHCNATLADGKGVAFIPTPAQGQLGPFQEVLVEVTAFCNMWGEYNDHLICKIGSLDLVKIPIHLETIGCPLNFQISKEPSPILRFGSHISGGDVCSRSLKINNTGPCDIRLDWESYVMEPNDNQIMDLLVMIGDPFPLLDDKGEEIEDADGFAEPLIKVKMNPHQGRRVDLPFQMTPKQMIIPAKSHFHATAKFTPTVNLRSKLDLQGYALGFMSLAKKDLMSEHTLRCDGIDVAPFHLNFTAAVKPARLFIEPESEDGFHFEVASSILLHSDDFHTYQVLADAVSSRRFVLSNQSGTPLRFSMQIEKPFEISPEKTKTTSSVVDEKEIQFDMKPDDNFEVRIGLRLMESLLQSNLQEANNERSREVTESCEKHNAVSRLDLKRQLRLKFANNTIQTYDITCTIQLPVLELSQHVLEFGTCLVGQERELSFTLKNSGKSSSYWTAEIDKDSPETSKSVFSIIPACGLLEADVKYNMKSTETVKVTFQARHCVEYECDVIFKSLLGDNCLTLKVRGRGSYDQISEKLVNVLT